MPGLDLSSNWKILQARLQAGKRAEEAKNERVKRKRPAEESTRYKQHSKGPRATGDNTTALGKRRKMGSYVSSETAPAVSHSTLIKDHDIPAADVSAAYGGSVPSTKLASFVDNVNGGLHPTHKVGKYLSLDCEMVGIGPPPHDDHMLARVSLVNFHGEQVYDSYVLPQAKVADYRTHVSGITPEHLRVGYARPFAEVQATVAELLKGRILVGHALRSDMRVLVLSHHPRDTRDTSRYPKFRIESKGKPPALRKLALSELGMKIQSGEHSSVEDARAAMLLFRKEKAGFDEECRRVHGAQSTFGRKKQEAGRQAREEDDDDDDVESEEENDLETLDGEDDDAVKPVASQVKKKRKKKKNTRRK